MAEKSLFRRDSAAQLFVTEIKCPISPAVLRSCFQLSLQLDLFLKRLFCRSWWARAERHRAVTLVVVAREAKQWLWGASRSH